MTTQRQRTEALLQELVRHGYPVHLDVLTAMALDRHRRLFRDPRDVIRTVASQADVFANLGSGIFGIGRGLRSDATESVALVVLRWPDSDVAALLGAMCARGKLDFDSGLVAINLRYGGRAYSHKGRTGFIGKGAIAYRASDVVAFVPDHLAKVARRALPRHRVTVYETGNTSFEVEIDCSSQRAVLDELAALLRPGTDYRSFTVPDVLFESKPDVRRSFLRGFGLACGLASSGTNLYGHQEQVWLRPDTSNKVQFHQVIALVASVGIRAYWNDRDERDISVKINCEDWESIGFGVDWLDSIVAEGARINTLHGYATRPALSPPAKATQPTGGVEANKADPSVVRIGSTVTVEIDGSDERYTLVADDASDAASGKLAIGSPLGRSLLGQREGNTVAVRAPQGTFDARLVKVAQHAKKG